MEQPESHRLVEIPYNEVQLFEIVGKGAFGVVRRAFWNDKEVAVKIIDNPEGKRSLMAEVRQLSRVHHPQVVTLYGIFVRESLHLVMEFAPTGSLHDLLHGTRNYQQTKYTLAHALNWCLQCARGVEYLHSMKPKPIVHRDLKPQNLLMFDSGLTVKLCDFGTACDARTQMTTNRGSPLWMAPEVFSGDRYTEKCDIYSWGIILWQILCRHQPYEMLRGADAYSILFRVHGGMRPNPIAGCPAALETLMKACWNTDHTARPVISECVRVISVLMRFLSGHDAPLFSVPVVQPRQRNISSELQSSNASALSSNEGLLIHASTAQDGRHRFIVAEIVEDPPLVPRQWLNASAYTQASASGSSSHFSEQRARNASASNASANPYPKRSSIDNASGEGEAYNGIILQFGGGATNLPKRDNSFQKGHRRGGSHGDQQSIKDFLYGPSSSSSYSAGNATPQVASGSRPVPAAAIGSNRNSLRRSSPFAQECWAMQTIVKEIQGELKPIEPIANNPESVQIYHDHVRLYRDYLRVKLEEILLAERKYQLEKEFSVAAQLRASGSTVTSPSLQEEFLKVQRENSELKQKKKSFNEQLSHLQGRRMGPNRDN